MSKHHRHENDCLNCGAELQGHFCHNCGQENMHVKEPFWHFLSHSISHYFHFDSKFFETLVPLLTKPGQLTLDYLAGKRARYLHPVSMYIFVSILYFLIVPNFQKTHDKSEGSMMEVNLTDSNKHKVDTIEAAKKALANINMGDKAQAKIQRSLSKAQEKIKARGTFKKLPITAEARVLDSLKKANGLRPTDSLDDKIDAYEDIYIERVDTTYESYLNRQKTLPASEQDNFFKKFTKEHDIEIKQKTKKGFDFDKELEHYQPKIYFILMPLFAFFLMINFRRNHRYYVEHIVFTLQFLTAFFIFEIVTQPINYLIFKHSTKVLQIITFWVVCWYAYKALRTFYGRSRWVTIRKLVTLGIMYFIAFSISFGIIYEIVYLLA